MTLRRSAVILWRSVHPGDVLGEARVWPADLGVDLDHSGVGVADPGVDLEQLVPERESLRGHAGAGRLLVDRGRGGVVGRFQGGSDGGDEDG